MKTAYRDIAPFVTKDGSEIRELLHPAHHGPGAMSFAEAIVEPGCTTHEHLHSTSEEIYYVKQGSGRMRLAESEFDICTGDTIRILPQTIHNVTNTGSQPLRILCVCNPPYRDEDTKLS